MNSTRKTVNDTRKTVNDTRAAVDDTRAAGKDDIYERPNRNTSLNRLEPLAEATHSLGLKDTRVTMRLVREGKLRAFKISTRIYITTKSLNEFVGA